MQVLISVVVSIDYYVDWFCLTEEAIQVMRCMWGWIIMRSW